MSWQDLLAKPDDSVTVPWTGGRVVRGLGRTFKLKGRQPPEHGWHEFNITAGRTVSWKTDTEADWDLADRFPTVVGYLVGNRLIPDGAHVVPDPAQITGQSVEVHLIEPGLERFPMSDTYYYTASPEAAEAIESYFNEVREAREQAYELKTRLGAKSIYTRGSRVVGFEFEPGSEPTDDKLLRRDRETRTMWVPSARYKAGKDLRDELAECKAGPDGMELTHRLYGSAFALMGLAPGGRGMRTASPGVEKLDGEWIISVDRDKAPLELNPSEEE